jgi:transposase
MRPWSRKRQAVPDLQCGIVVGIDISKGRIDYGAFRRDRASRPKKASQDLAGFLELEAFLEGLRAQGCEVWVAMEPTGPYGKCLLAWLRERGWRVVLVNPFHVKRTREIGDNNPASTDQKSAGVIAELVWRGEYFLPIALEGAYAELRAQSREWESLTRKRTRVRNECGALLEEWFPELRTQFRNPLTKSVRGIVRAYASVGEMRHRGRRRLRRVLAKATQGRGAYRAEAILAAARVSIAPRHGQRARQRQLCQLLAELELFERRQQELRGEMEVELAQTTEGRFLLSVPGVGTITVARLLGECGPLGGFSSYGRLEKFLGLNLYSVKSGLQESETHVSKRGRGPARQVICQAAIWQMRRGGLFRGLAQRLREEKRKTGQVRVAVARQLLALLYALARDRQEFAWERFAGARTEDGGVIPCGAQPAMAA